MRATRPPVINPDVPEPVRPVDLGRYVGKWYELARHENRFEKGLDGCTAEYAQRDGGKIEVVNRGMRGWPDGDVQEARATAIIADEQSNAKLKVAFFGPLYTGDYWVLDHDEAYSWAIVGEPTGRYLWVLSRDARPEPAEAEAILKRVEELGYDRWALRPTRQS
ncbi:lipocalin [Sphingosinithalassobacter tenebrarum]|uniref:Outer membrane lipoprotein Blc n=2 Tax=Stakelama tenebrarum TaxID=2711215 RepID=A0A6G6YAX5_9SPHN|nr:lipocalin [Sphingosinithalassobacter tenebrarum]